MRSRPGEGGVRCLLVTLQTAAEVEVEVEL